MRQKAQQPAVGFIGRKMLPIPPFRRSCNDTSSITPGTKGVNIQVIYNPYPGKERVTGWFSDEFCDLPALGESSPASVETIGGMRNIDKMGAGPNPERAMRSGFYGLFMQNKRQAAVERTEKDFSG